MLRRGWAIVVVALAAALLAASCATGPSGTSSELDASLPTATPVASALDESDAARARVAELRAQFATTPAPHRSPSHLQAIGPQTAPAPRPAIPAGLAPRFDSLDATHIRPVIPDAAKHAVLRSATVTLPTSANGAVELEDDTTHVAVKFALRGASDAKVEVAGGIAVYPGAYGGGDVVHRPHAEGTEDYVVFEEKPGEEAIEYDVDVTRVAGLRLVSNVLEFLDETGTPRLRIRTPYVVESTGERLAATVALGGCAYDENSAAPWTRSIVPAGARVCVVRVTWAAAAYPAVVDPSWIATGSMTTPRVSHTMTPLVSGEVLVAGGADSSGDLASAELFNGTSSFAATGSMTTAREDQTATLLGSGKVLIAGGDNGSALSSAELFNGSTFTATGSMTTAREGSQTATLLTAAPNAGKVLIAGGWSGSAGLSSAELFDGTSTFSVTSKSGVQTWMTTSRYGHTATLLPSGKVLIAGGLTASNMWPGSATAELFDGTSSFALTGSMTIPRDGQTAVLLGSGEVLIASGYSSGYAIVSSAELYNPVSATFATTGSMTAAWLGPTVTLLGSGSVLYAGGQNGSGTQVSSADIFNGTSTFAAASSMTTVREDHAAALLTSGNVLVTGGISGTQPLSSAEIFTFVAVGATCTAGSQCASGACDEGVCCGTACPNNNVCYACATGTGACVLVTNTTDPDNCTGTMTCSASGACLLQNGQPSSSGPPCASGFASDGVCCNAACSGACDVCTAALGASADGTCTTAPLGYAGNPSCTPFVCNAALTTCPPTCTTDTGCESGYYCNAANQCVVQKTASSGATCGNADCASPPCRECASGDCVDGYCCNGGCGEPCEYCNQAAELGTCAPAPLSNPGRTTCPTYACDGNDVTCPNPSTATCISDAFCAAGDYCNKSGHCVTQVATGAACNPTAGNDCLVSNCRDCANGCGDGFCCATPCGGSCAECASSTGACGASPAGSPGTPSCGAYLCNGSSLACPSNCTPPNTGCAPGYYCTATGGGTCVPIQANGASCNSPTQCQSGFCWDDVCCNTACGPCGLCGTAYGAPTNGACVAAPSGFVGYEGVCSPYLCDGSDLGCPGRCSSDLNCATGSFCNVNGLCVTQKAQGASCSTVAGKDCLQGNCRECASGGCVDGVCCSTASCGSCQDCDLVGSVGTCATITNAPDPDNCNGTVTCSATGVCALVNGQTCTPNGPNAACASGNCVDGVCCGSAACGTCQACDLTGSLGTCAAVLDANDPDSCNPATSTCNGAGQCTSDQGQACANGSSCAEGNCVDGVCCAQSACATCQMCNLAGSVGTCALVKNGVDPDSCSGNNTCNATGNCTLAQGQPCDANGACASGFCVDGFCCGSACSSPCQVCSQALGATANGACTTAPYGNTGTTDAGVPNGGGCGAYVCPGPGDGGPSSTVCESTCSTDADCATGFYCNGSKACVAKETNGTTGCTSVDQCASGNCVDGVCCSKSACGTCQMCNVPGSVGTCTTITNAQDPDSCTGTNSCNASGQCTLAAGQVCGSSSACASGFCLDGHCCGTSSCGSCQECTGASGTCVAVTNAPDPDNCTGTKSCNASGVCETANGLSCTPNGPNATCASGFCVDGACCGTSSCGSCQECTGANGTCVTITGQPDPDNCSGTHICSAGGACLLANGQTCSPNGPNQACASGNCVDGVCCGASACPTCQQCNLSGSGTCTVVTNAQDPDSCTGTNMCNASGQCTLAQGQPCSANGACASDFCVDGVCCATACSGQCDVCSTALGATTNGTCAIAPAGYAGSPSCVAFLCNGTSAGCPAGCTSDSGCATGDYCNGSGLCVARGAAGIACTASDQCQNGDCVDGYCCNTACTGACDTCKATPGTCTQLAKDSPGNGRALADGGTETCAPYTCPGGSDSCAAACSADHDCASGFYCDENGACQPQKAQGATCSNAAGLQCIEASCRECATGNCVDGVCCGSAACGSCQMCNLAGSLGTCSAVKNAPDPDSCTGTQSCNASGQCEAATGQGCTNGSGCASGFCVTGVCCATACAGACDVCPSGTCAQAALGYAPTPACANGLVCAGGSDSCPPGCTSDAQCVASDYCSAGSCTPRQPLGATCGATDQCQSGTCFDGVCCTAGCSGACSVCTVAHGAPATGTCTTAPLGYAGSPACLVFACNGSSTGCPSATTSQCGSDAACETGYYCGADATCHLKKTTGATCNVTAGADCLQASCGECASGGCVDGVCCSTSSCGSCEACDLAGSVGTCATVKNGPDPDNCTGVDTCDANGVCRSVDGQACASGGTCASTFCADGVCCTSACAGGCNFCNVTAEPCGPATAPFFCVSGQHCVNDVCVAGGDYTGTCTVTPNPSLGANPSCAPLLCNTTSGACPASCTSDANCEPGEYCSANGTCQVQKAAAAKCNDGAGQDCEVAGCRVCVEGAGSCADGYCCNTTCSGACNGCNGADLDWPAAVDGTCAVAPAGFSGNPSCGSYACDGHDTTCSSTCTSDVDCAASDYCASNGTCQPRKSQGAVCNDAAGQDCLTPTCRECTTGAGMCIDGFCCNATCSGSCNACDGATLGWAGALNGTCAIAPAGYAGAPSCSLSPTFSVCDGTQSTCEGACTTDAECASDGYCNSSGQCASKQALGAACTTGSGDQCTSGFCQDGVCCNTACAGTCQACAAILKESGAQDGICGATADGKAPHDDCVAAAPSSCKQNGLCNGLGACADYPSGTSCGTTACTAGNLETGFSCDGAGNCVQSAGGTTCAPYLCEGTACKTPCVTTSDCVGGNFCDNGTCKGLFTNGTACTAATAGSCSSGFCVEGVCCNSECNGTCQTCLATNQAAAADGGAPVNGTCGPVQAGLADPTGNCTNAGAASCGTNGLCTASGGCADFPGGTPCAATVCAGNAVQTSLCNGTGTCLSSASSCGSFACVGGSCNTTCQADSDCATGSWCNAGTCQVRAATGAACTLSDACVSQFCVDGVCCNNACNTTCQACAAGLKQSGTDDGICGPSAANTAPHQDCTADDHNSCEQDGKCDGLGDCALFALGTPCNGGNDTCVANALTSYECNGFGVCEVDSSSSTDCTPYACNAAQTTCPTSCTNDGGCFTGYYCDAGACTAQAGLGGACSAPDACGTGFCVDGVCCNTLCNGTCQTCLAANQVSGPGVADGTCGDAKEGIDPHSDCPNAGAASCLTDGECDGAGHCEDFAAGTTCADPTCTGNDPTTYACNGTGTCVQSVGQPCDPFLCGSGTCDSTCKNDQECGPTSWCNAGVCTPTSAQGATCTQSDQCSTNFCVDGFCCNGACNGTCEACAAALKTSASGDGECGPATAGSAESACTTDPKTSCQQDGTCDGSGNCRLYQQGTACGTNTACVGNVETGSACNGFGVCESSGTGVPCDPYICKGSACATPCQGDTDCVAGNYCASGTCTARIALGGACTPATANSCGSGFCVEGVCCNSACNGTCQSCLAKNQGPTADGGAPSSGTCGTAVAGFADLSGNCTNQGSVSCGTNGLCNSAGGCADYPVGTSCGQTVCTGSAVQVSLCNGTGTCLSTATTCGTYGCTGGVCKTTCATSADCAAGSYCDGTTCEPTAAQGVACTTNAACTSGICVDDVCCNSACDGQCEACNVPATLGTCTPVVGAPQSPRAACAAGTASSPCTQALCDGIHTTSCDTFVGSSVTCGAASCSDGPTTSSSQATGSCDGDGSCKLPAPSSCGTFACNGTACRTACTVDTDCAGSNKCDTSTSLCVSGSTCGTDGVTLTSPDGTTTDCAPFKCEGSACLTACKSVDDCASPAVCNTSGACVAPASNGGSGTSSSGGCGCETVGAQGDRSSGARWLGLLGLVAALAGARRRKNAVASPPLRS